MASGVQQREVWPSFQWVRYSSIMGACGEISWWLWSGWSHPLLLLPWVVDILVVGIPVTSHRLPLGIYTMGLLVVTSLLSCSRHNCVCVFIALAKAWRICGYLDLCFHRFHWHLKSCWEGCFPLLNSKYVKNWNNTHRSVFIVFLPVLSWIHFLEKYLWLRRIVCDRLLMLIMCSCANTSCNI